MMNLYISLKLWWVIFAIFGLCLMASPALADNTRPLAWEADSNGSLKRQIPLDAEKRQNQSPAEVLRVPYFSANSLLNEDEFVFESEGGELLLAANRSYSSALTEKTERASVRGKIKLDSNYFKGIFTDTGYAVTSPWRWDKSDWTTAAIVAGVTGTFFVLDDEINEEVQTSRSSTTDDIASVFEPFGNSSFTVPALIGFYIYGRFGENEKVERTALLATESFLVTSLFVGVLKVGMGRVRPAVVGSSANDFRGPIEEGSGHSFPSGHTSTAFAIATVVANEYDGVPMIAPISYGLATLVGFSRINDEKHWASDVVFGAALGYFTSKTILRLHSNKKGRHFTIYPHADSRGGGLILSTRF
jgi:membrane-associated phospholipid phosphatase